MKPAVYNITFEDLELDGWNKNMGLLFRQRLADFLGTGIDVITITNVSAGSVVVQYMIPGKI